MNRVQTILLYPIKSLDGIPVQEAVVLQGGALRHDREFAMVDERGSVINGKREPRTHRIRSGFDLNQMSVALSAPGMDPVEFSLLQDVKSIEQWLSAFLNTPVRLQRNQESGFPDDLDSPGPTVAASGTIEKIRQWFGLSSHSETLRRFRTNIEIEAEAFWDDRLYGREGAAVAFQIGDVTVHGINPCQRCAVPSRDPSTGTVIENFQRTFSERRAASLPSWAEASRFNHYYRFSVNTRIPASEAGKTLRVGDPVRL